jgi:hypothetical protein
VASERWKSLVVCVCKGYLRGIAATCVLKFPII